MEPGKYDPRYSGELLKHMDKQNEVLMETYRSMLHELQKLQVEEEMIMRKLYEVMSVHGLTKQTTPTLPLIVLELNKSIMKSGQHMKINKENFARIIKFPSLVDQY
ncbi:uncharacterized protein LOC127095784 isoform X1 [Lathyrus oleraceus]|uniref:Uncharacterized protein n=1 Tax=Pisum sativum TaxID=3888 RepID=A0A9D4W6Q7_PEA|nr:uncharacterized protein LOC127095784 isoform X1 [Pisum sativum]KAI5395764.1 hypothetical protein KIW84_062082 [Pisum sativum]